jgi:hypothetical protein
MRAIETEMLTAIINQDEFRQANTEVKQFRNLNTAFVRLHGNLIAEIDYNTGTATYFSAGWKTTTTKSRLNALGSLFHLSVYQRKGTWYVSSYANPTDPYDPEFTEGVTATNPEMIRTNPLLEGVAA